MPGFIVTLNIASSPTTIGESTLTSTEVDILLTFKVTVFEVFPRYLSVSANVALIVYVAFAKSLKVKLPSPLVKDTVYSLPFTLTVTVALIAWLSLILTTLVPSTLITASLRVTVKLVGILLTANFLTDKADPVKFTSPANEALILYVLLIKSPIL